jgi:predicted lactoylglutathione lyase
MARQIFVNLPVKDLNRSIEFFTALGFTFNQQFTDEKATCMVISDDIFAMLLVEPYFKTFTNKEVSDAKKSTEVILALSCESRDQVNEMVTKATNAGGTIIREAQDYGWMLQHGFQDLDGHLWEVIYMDESAMSQGEQS